MSAGADALQPTSRAAANLEARNGRRHRAGMEEMARGVSDDRPLPCQRCRGRVRYRLFRRSGRCRVRGRTGAHGRHGLSRQVPQSGRGAPLKTRACKLRWGAVPCTCLRDQAFAARTTSVARPAPPGSNLLLPRSQGLQSPRLQPDGNDLGQPSSPADGSPRLPGFFVWPPAEMPAAAGARSAPAHSRRE